MTNRTWTVTYKVEIMEAESAEEAARMVLTGLLNGEHFPCTLTAATDWIPLPDGEKMRTSQDVRFDRDPRPCHHVRCTQNEHGDAWCVDCGERLLLAGCAGGPAETPH